MSVNAPDPCRQPGCDGAVEGEYCNVCGMRAATSATSSMRMPVASGPPPAGATVVTRAGTARTSHTTNAGRRRIAGIVELPAHEPRNPAAAILADPRVAEEKRFCATRRTARPSAVAATGGLGAPRASAAGAGRRSRSPKLARGRPRRRAVRGRGLPRARRARLDLPRPRPQASHDKWVVLKGLLNTGDADAPRRGTRRAAVPRRGRAPDIVKIFNFVEHGSDGYIVMEYVRGHEPAGCCSRNAARRTAARDPLPAAHAIAYMLEILPALGYLHQHGPAVLRLQARQRDADRHDG